MITHNFPRNECDISGIFLYELFSKMAKVINVHVIAPHDKDAKIEEKMNGISIHRFRYAYPESMEVLAYDRRIHKLILTQGILYKLLGLFFIISAILKTCHVIRKENITLIHSHWILPSGLIGYICAKLTGRPIVITSHGSDLRGFMPKSIIGKIISFIARRSDALIVVGEELFDLASSIYSIHRSKILLMPIGIDEEKFRPLPEKIDSSPMILFLGALNEFRGPTYLLSAIPSVLKKVPECNFIFAGEGALKKTLEAKERILNISSNTKFLGIVSHNNIPYLINRAWVVVFTSPYGNYPSVALYESMSCQKAIVATKTGKTELLINNEITGLLTSLDPESIAHAIIRLILDEKLRIKLGKNARSAIVKDFSISRNVKKLIKVYRAIIMN